MRDVCGSGKPFEKIICGVSAYVGSLGVSDPLGGVGGVGVRMIPGIPLYTVYAPKKRSASQLYIEMQ